MNALAYWHDGGPGPWILLFPFLWIVVIGGAILLVRRTVGRGRGPWQPTRPAGPGTPPPGPRQDSPLDLLGRRFAAGEIDEDEYWSRFSVLQEGSRPGPGGEA